MTIPQDIRHIADTRGISIEKAMQSACDGITKAIDCKDVVCVYKDGQFKTMRKIKDDGLYSLLYDVINEKLQSYYQGDLK